MTTFSQRSMTMVPFRWVRWSLQYGANWPHPQGWCPLWGELYLQFGIPPERDEREVCRLGLFCITRPETAEEREDREYGEAEDAFCAHELHRYTEWSY